MNEFLPYLAIAFSALGFMAQQFGVIAKLQERITRVESCTVDMAQLREDVTSIKTKTDLFWKAIEGNVLSMLKSYPTHLEKDVLLDKMLHNELCLEEAQVLRTILIGEMELGKNKENKMAYVLALARIEQIIFDLGRRRT
jgi:hypothetical protein